MIPTAVVAALRGLVARQAAFADTPVSDPGDFDRERKRLRHARRMLAVRAHELDELRVLLHARRAGGSPATAFEASSLPHTGHATGPQTLEPAALRRRIEAIEAEVSSTWFPTTTIRLSGPAPLQPALRDAPPTVPMAQDEPLLDVVYPVSPPDGAPAPGDAARHAGAESPDESGQDAPTPDHDELMDAAASLLVTGQVAAMTALLARAVAAPHGGADDRRVWLALLEAYRVTGQQALFDMLADEYLAHFHVAAPVAAPHGSGAPAPTDQGTAWTCAGRVGRNEADALCRLVMQTRGALTLDWSALWRLDDDARAGLQQAIGAALAQKRCFRHVAPVRLMQCLASRCDAAGDTRAWWLLRFTLLRWMDKAAIHESLVAPYCHRFEFSAPDWEAPLNTTDILRAPLAAAQPGCDMALQGRICGDKSTQLGELRKRLAAQPQGPFRVDCGALVSLDFVAAVDLLNAIAARGPGRGEVTLAGVHPVLARLMSMVGIRAHEPD